MSQVVIGDILPYTQATAILNQTVFGTNWTANTESDVVVYVTPPGDVPNDVTQILPYPAGYSVAFIGALQEVQVTLVTPSVAGAIVTITRQTPADRMNLYTNTNFIPSMLNNDFGILTLVDQQAQLVNQLIGPRYNYSANIAPDVSFPNANIILPILQANQFWAKNAANNEIVALDLGIVVGGTVTEIDTGLGLTGGPITTIGTISMLPTLPSSIQLNITQLGVLIQALDMGSHLIHNVSDPLSAQDAATKAYVDSSGGAFLPLAGGTMLGAINMGAHQINNMTDPSLAQDAATKAYVDSFNGLFLPLAGGTMSGIIDMGNHKIVNVTNPSSAQDAVTLSYLNTQLAFYLPLTGGTMSGLINMGSNKIVSLLDPSNPQDAATKNYVDSVASGFAVQPAVYAATTTSLTAIYNNGASGIGASLTNSGAFAVFSIDGVNPPTNARVLIKNQPSTFIDNGIYTVANVGDAISIPWVLIRASDYDQPSEIQPGDLVIVNNGATQAGTSFIETASVATIGTDPILFSQFTFSATAVLLKANNLNDVANTTTSFNNISPLTTKGDLIGFSSQNVRLAVGSTNGQILQVNSAAATGLAWSTATYPVTTTANQILYSSATNVVSGISTLAGGVLVTDASSVPQFLTNPTATGKILMSGNGTIPTWSTAIYPSTAGTSGNVLTSDGTNWVSSANPATTLLTTKGDLFSFSTVNARLAVGSTNGQILQVNSGATVGLSYSTAAYPTAAGTTGNVLTSDGTNWISSPSTGVTVLTTKGDILGFSTVNARIPVGSTNGQILQADSTSSVGVSYSVPSYPSASATSRKIIVSNGTNFVASTETWAVPGSANNSLVSDGTNWVALATNPVIQRVSTETGAVATGTTTIPFDDTIPQNTEGNQFMTLAITPKNSANILVIEVTCVVSCSATANDNICVALFQDSTANALAVGDYFYNVANAIGMVSFKHIMTAGTTSATTFKIRAGASGAGTTTFNGQSGARKYGGVYASSIIITEYTT